MKGDWAQGTILYVNAVQISTNAEGMITTIGISYAVIVPESLTSYGNQYIYEVPQGTMQTSVVQAVSDAINAAMAFEGLPL